MLNVTGTHSVSQFPTLPESCFLILRVHHYFPDALDNILHGALGTETGPTPIRDLTTQKLVRPASATFALNSLEYCLRFLLMIMMLSNLACQSLTTCPDFGYHFTLYRCH